MDDEEEGGGKKEPLFVEGVDINSISQAELLRHVQGMLDELVFERAERGRAQAEADLARTAWSSVEDELKTARCRLYTLRLEAERAGATTSEEQYIILPETGPRKERLEAVVKGMAERLPAAFDKRLGLQPWRSEEGAVDTGKEVVTAVDRHLAFAEEQLTRVTSSKKWSRVRERHLRTFYQVQQIEVEESKASLIHQLGTVHQESFYKIQDFFKKIIQKDLFLMLCLKDRIASLKSLKEQRRQALAEDQKGLLALKSDMKALLNQIVKGYRKAKMYESNKLLSNHCDCLIRSKEKEIEELCQKKKLVEEKLAINEATKAKYLEVMKSMKKERDQMIERFKKPAIFKGFDEYFSELMGLLEIGTKAANVDPNTLSALRMAVDRDHEAISLLESKVCREAKATADLIKAVEQRLQECGIITASNFRGHPVLES